MKNKEGQTVTFELSEHDATLILSLVKKEGTATVEIWRSYWESLAQTLEQSILRSSLIHQHIWNDKRLNKDEIQPEPNNSH